MQKLLEELFSRYYLDVYHYLYGLCRDAALAEELTAETFFEAVHAFAGFRRESDPKTWLFAIARHRWLHYLRRKTGHPDPAPLDELLPDSGETPEEQYCRKELLQRTAALLDAEPERTRTILKLRMAGYSFYEIGHRLGLSESSVRVIAFRTRKKFCQILQKEGFLP